MIKWLEKCIVIFIAVQSVKACNHDEECISLLNCGDLYEQYLKRDYSKIRVCGIEDRTDKICCKITAEAFKINQVPRIAAALNTHPNINQINHKKCGISYTNRIVNGKNANVGEFPWMALLMYKKNNDDKIHYTCGGSLISARYVLTAAHCIDPINYEMIGVRLGEHTISTEKDCDDPGDPSSCSTDNPPFQDLEISQKIVPKEYINSTQGYDIALLLLKTEVKFKNIANIETVCLPVYPSQNIDSIRQEEGTKLKMVVSGWGWTENRIGSDILQQTAVSYADSSGCEQDYRKFTRSLLKIHDNQLCAGGDTYTDSCNGDSGSPLVYPAQHQISEKILRPRMFQHGLVSYGSRDCSITVPMPGVYTRISSHMTWILDNLA